MNLKDFTWKCDMCGKTRPDAKISVLTYPLKDLPHAERNLKYCNDDQWCLAKAKLKAKTQTI